MRSRPRADRPAAVRLLPALLAAPLLVGVTATPAAACSCAGQSLQESRRQADVVLAGEVLRREEPDGSGSSTARATYVVQVDRVYEGEAFEVQEVVTVVSGASCGLELPASGPALLFAGRHGVDWLGLDPDPGQLVATLCGGSQVGTQVPADFGAGWAPVPGRSVDRAADEGAGLPAAPLLAGALGLAGAVALAVVGARRRRG